MPDYRDTLFKLCQQEDRPSQEAAAQILAGIEPLELLSFLDDAVADLLAMVEDIPNLILDGLEEKLPTDARSKQATAVILARLNASPEMPLDRPMPHDPTNRQVQPFASFVEDAAAPCPKLTDAQRRVIKWLGKKWETTPGAGMAIHINGKRVCNVDTLNALERLGLVEQIEVDGRKAVGRWKATPAGRALAQQLGL